MCSSDLTALEEIHPDDDTTIDFPVQYALAPGQGYLCEYPTLSPGTGLGRPQVSLTWHWQEVPL